MNNKTLIIGYGNRDREDDGAGWHILAAIAHRMGLEPPEFAGEWVDSQDGGTRLLYLFQLLPEMAEDLPEYQRIYFIDAHNSASLPELAFASVAPTEEHSAFTHHMSPGELLAITETICGCRPPAMLLSVRGYSFQFKQELSARTAELVTQAVETLAAALNLPGEMPEMAETSLEPFRERTVWRYSREGGIPIKQDKPVIREHTARLVVNQEPWLTFICSPTELEALATGFLWNENVITDLRGVDSLEISTDLQEIKVTLRRPTTRPEHFHRTSTGIEIDSNHMLDPIAEPFTLSAAQVVALYQQFMDKQALHEQVGGFHSAGLSDGTGVQILVEDLGRHNCVDKLAGRYLLESKPFTPRAILLSGRISSEMIYKSLTLRVPFIISRTTPTDLAVQIAEQVGITLVGYLRGGHFEVFSRPERVIP